MAMLCPSCRQGYLNSTSTSTMKNGLKFTSRTCGHCGATYQALQLLLPVNETFSFRKVLRNSRSVTLSCGDEELSVEF